MAKRLMVLISDSLSTIARKGEITPRYYNPGELFEEVYILATNDDEVTPAEFQSTVGQAELSLRYVPLPTHGFLSTLGYQQFLLNRWAETGVRLAKEIKPNLIRCYGNGFNAYMGSRIRRKLGVPMVVSLHVVPDKDFQPRTFLGKINSKALRRVEQPALRSADHFIAVYNPIVPYLQRNEVKAYSVIYNAVGYSAVPKQTYDLHRPIRLLTVGNQLRDHKDPMHIVEAASELQNVELKLIGTGDVHERLMTLARELQCEARCEFIPAMRNEQVLAEMQQADIYVFNQSMLGISKTVMEAALTGLPIIVNRRPGGAKDELNADWLLQVEDSKDGYSRGIRELIANNAERERLGRAAYAHARETWAPQDMESKVATLYQQILDRSQP